MNPILLVTSNRALEQFLYAHRIPFHTQRKENGMTHWVYPVEPRLLEIVREYLNLYKEGDV